MGKKSKQKQHRKANKPAQQTKTTPVSLNTNQGFTLKVDMPTNSQLGTVLPPTSSTKPSSQVAPVVSEEYIRQDIRRIILTLSVLVIILIAAVVLNDKTTYLLRAGKHLASFLKLQ